MHDYLKHQRSAELIDEIRETKQRAGRMGNHKRWHVEQGIVDQTCEFCMDLASQEVSQVRSQPDRTGTSGSDRKTSPETETETDKELSLRSSSLRASRDPEFEEFWSAYPRKDGKAAARKAWPKASKRLEPERLAAAARYWTGLWERAGLTKQFIPHAATWLNGERWDDEPPVPRVPNGQHVPFHNPPDQSVYDEELL
jgi:hypothetical protein